MSKNRNRNNFKNSTSLNPKNSQAPVQGMMISNKPNETPNTQENFTINCPIETLRQRKLFIGTPMYGGMCNGVFCRSIADLTALCTANGIQIMMYYLFNESLITRARNYVCDEFLRSPATHLLFLDSDIGFNPQDVLAMLALQDHEKDDEYDVLCCPYPKKCISWEKIKLAVDKGFADKDPNELTKFVGDYVFNPVSGNNSFPVNRPAEISEGGTGYMMIRRKTFEKFMEAYPDKTYLPDHVRTEAFDGHREIGLYFDCAVDPVTRRYLSEDYNFCQMVRKAGMHIWLLPWVASVHHGSMGFGGSLADLAALGCSATADPSMLGKKS